MASSSTPSSSSHLIPWSFSESWIYDVFVSFRGEDTRKSFVDHLYASLVQKGILTFKDDKTLSRGESIGPSLLEAIEESRIAVIVFSKNYADSSWCLDELAHIMECKTTRGHIVMPVFYDVDRSDVRKQEGSFKEAFAKHELVNNNKVELWRKALTAASNLSGWGPEDFAYGHEAKWIKDIVESISSKLHPSILKVSKELIGIETRLQDLKSMLQTGSSGGVRIVGILGLGGCGKTTLASAVYSEMSVHFEGHCFLENIREESRKHGLTMLQENILSSILKTEVAVQCEEEGKSIIKRSLCHKKVLLVLDDVDNPQQLEALAGSHDWFGEGSRIIITTRDKHMLTRKADSIYGVSLLSHDEAMKLFRAHAYQEDKPQEDYEILSEKLVSYAGGLPLTVKVLGSSLYDKDKDEWKSALAKLKDIPDHDVMETLKISYDGLDPDEKNLFLDDACFQGNDRVQSSVWSIKLNHPYLPQVRANMKNAHWISLESFPESSLPTKLGCLTLRNSLLKELWQGFKEHTKQNFNTTLASASISFNRMDSKPVIRSGCVPVAKSVPDGKVVAEPANPQSFAYFSYLFAVVGIIIFLSGAVRSSLRQNPSLFKDHGGVFTTMIIVSGSMVVLASGILILASFLLQSLMKDIHYTILKTIGSFSAVILSFSLGAVVFLPSGDLNWIAYTVSCAIFVVILYLYSFIWKVACPYHKEEHFNSYPVHWAFLLIILVPFSMTLVPFSPQTSGGRN